MEKCTFSYIQEMQDEGLPARHCKAEDCFAIFLHLEVQLAQKHPS